MSASELPVVRRDEAPSVSVVMPTFNRLHYLTAAVESVFAQTFTDWELLIADDGSNERTLAYLRSLGAHARVKLLRLTHSGNPGHARNYAIRRARGAFVAFLDSDDLWLPTKLEEQLRALQSERTSRWSYTAVTRIAPQGTPMPGEHTRRWIGYQGSIFEQLLTLEAAVATPTVMVERDLLRRSGGFDEQQAYFEDYDLWLRLNRLNDVSVLSKPLTLIRNHTEHYSGNQGAADTPQLRCALRAERASNAMQLAAAQARAGQRAAALHTLWQSRRCVWQTRARTWRKSSQMLVRALAPAWLRALARRPLAHRDPGAGSI